MAFNLLPAGLRNALRGTPAPVQEPYQEPDILKYLNDFSNPQSLIQGMAAANTIISGSRALEYFRPGSCAPGSDWDFYVPDNEDCISVALQALEDSGVVFVDVFEPLRKLVASNEPSRVHVTRRAMEALVVRATGWKSYPVAAVRDHVFTPTSFLDGDPVVARLLKTAGEALKQRNWWHPIHGSYSYEEYMSEEDVLDIKVSDEAKTPIYLDAGKGQVAVHFKRPSDQSIVLTDVGDHHYGPGINVIQGRTTHDGSDTPVQLITCHKHSPIDLIMGFYGSHIQCFISAYGAAHFYHELTMSNHAYYWPENMCAKYRPAALAGKTKYEQRGIEFVDRPSNATILRALDKHVSSGAKVIPFVFDFELPLRPVLIALRLKAMMALKWLEAEDCTWTVQDKGVAAEWAIWMGRSNASDSERFDFYDKFNSAAESGQGKEPKIKCHPRPKMYVLFRMVEGQRRDRYLLF